MTPSRAGLRGAAGSGTWLAQIKGKANTMTGIQRVTWAAAVVLACAVSGCAFCNRGTMHYNRTTTVGKELVDLKDAKDKGAINEEEYAKAKKDILEGGPVKFEASCSGKK